MCVCVCVCECVYAGLGNSKYIFKYKQMQFTNSHGHFRSVSRTTPYKFLIPAFCHKTATLSCFLTYHFSDTIKQHINHRHFPFFSSFFSGHGNSIDNKIPLLKKNKNVDLYPCPWGHNNYTDAYF